MRIMPTDGVAIPRIKTNPHADCPEPRIRGIACVELTGHPWACLLLSLLKRIEDRNRLVASSTNQDASTGSQRSCDSAPKKSSRDAKKRLSVVRTTRRIIGGERRESAPVFPYPWHPCNPWSFVIWLSASGGKAGLGLIGASSVAKVSLSIATDFGLGAATWPLSRSRLTPLPRCSLSLDRPTSPVPR